MVLVLQNNGSVGIVTELGAGRTRGSICGRGKRSLFLVLTVQTGFGPHSASQSVGNGVLPRRMKRPGREFVHEHLRHVEFKNECCHTSTTPHDVDTNIWAERIAYVTHNVYFQ
jgi:hypothetical protein